MLPHHPPKEVPHPRALAFLGDAVFEVRIREMAVAKGMRLSNDLHGFSTKLVNAEAQCDLLDHLMPMLTEKEQQLIKKARNQSVTAGRRSDHGAHRKATGFEALMGYWYLYEPARMEAFWQEYIVPYLEQCMER